MKYIPRQIENLIAESLKIFPCISLTGPRQSGKSTTLRELFGKKYTYVTFDDPLIVDYLDRDPRAFIKQYNDRVIFDEAQKAPQLFNYIKIAVDEDRHNYGKFILTGSGQFSLSKKITETLAGRIAALSLLPFQMSEIPTVWRKEQILKGSYPELIHLGYQHTSQWYGAYVNHYIERDVRNIANVGNLSDFQKFVKLLATRAAQELNASTLAREIGVTVKTIKSWISILQASYIVFLVPAYHKNLGKRIVKRPKLYFYDTGLVCYLCGIEQEGVLWKGPMAGPVFENYVAAEALKWITHHGLKDQLYYFRANSATEVDLLVENAAANRLYLIEIKSTATPRIEMFKHMAKIRDLEKSRQKQKREVLGALIYKGETIPDYYAGFSCLNYLESHKIFLPR